MMLPRHQYRSPKIRFAEGRLMYENLTSSPEVSTVIELLQNSNPDLQKLQDAITAGRNAHATNAEPEELNFTDKVAANLQSKNNPETTKNLQTLLERIKTEENLGGLSSAIAMVQQKLDSQSPTAPDVQPGQTPEKIETEAPTAFKTKIANTAESISNSVLPKSWTDHLSRPQKIAAGTIMTLGAGVLLWQLGKMLWNRGKKSADEGKEASEKSKGGFWKKLLIGTGITVAAFFGLRYISNSFKKTIDEQIKKLLPPLPDPETIKTTLNTVEAASGVGAGILAHTTNRLIENPLLPTLSDAAVEVASAKTQAEAVIIAAKYGGLLVWREGIWMLENGLEAVTVPFNATTKLLSGDFDDAWEGGWIYGTAGSAYVLGKGSITTLLTGKIRLPLTLRALGATGTRMVGFPLIFATDLTKGVMMIVSEDGRKLTKYAITRWGLLGWIKDIKANKNAAKGTAESMQEALRYFLSQRDILSLMKNHTEGIGSTGIVRAGSFNAVENASENLAKTILHNAQKVSDDLIANNQPVPKWLVDLINKNKNTDITKILDSVNEAGNAMEKALEEAASATNAAAKEAGAAYEAADTAKAAATADEAADVASDTAKTTAKSADAAEEVTEAVKNTLKTTSAADYVADGTISAQASKTTPISDIVINNSGIEIKGKNAIHTAETITPNMSAKSASVASDVMNNVADSTTAIRQTTNAVETTAEGIKTFDQLHDAINAAKAAKDNKKLIELLKNPILLQSAREGNKTAKALLRVQRLLTFGKWAGRALIVVGTLIDAAMIGVNEWEIAEAKKEGNIAKQQILEAKRQTLVVSGGAGLGTLALTGPAALLAVPVAVSSIYANSIYDSVIQWEKHSSEWMNETPEELKNKLDNLRYGALDEGKRVAVGHSLLYRGWRWGTSWTSASKEKNNEEDEEQHRRLENINSLMRQEILAAYFLKTMKVSHLPNESDNEFVKRTATLVRDRMNYIRQITEGTYDASLFGERVFEYAGNYAELMSMRRILETQGKTLQMNYEYNGKNKVLNLEDMSYVFGGEAHKNISHQTFSRTLYQYEQEVKIQQEAVQDLYSMEDIPETK